jgi:hypothetical protein
MSVQKSLMIQELLNTSQKYVQFKEQVHLSGTTL